MTPTKGDHVGTTEGRGRPSLPFRTGSHPGSRGTNARWFTIWIEMTRTTSDGRPATKRLKTPEMDEQVEFSENCKAQVSSDVGEHLTESHSGIEQSGDSDGDEPDDDPDDESD